MKKQTKEQHIFSLAIIGKTQTEIAHYLQGKFKSNKIIVNRAIHKFLKKKWLECVDPKAYCKTYRATPIAPTKQQEKKVNLLRSPPDSTRIHNLCWSYKILDNIKRKISWDKEVELKNNVTEYLIYFPTVTVAYFPTAKKILVWLEEKYLEDADDWEKVANKDMLTAHAWLQKLLLCRLSLPMISTAEHFARPIRNPEVMNVLKRQGIMRVGNVWIDASRSGFKYGEIESTDKDKLAIMEKLQWADMNIPNRMDTMEHNMDRLTITVGKMTEVQLGTTEAVSRMELQLKVMMEPKQTTLVLDPPDERMYG